MIGSIFISYRRGDTEGYAGRIYDRLRGQFPDLEIFMDVDTIEPGEDFVEVIEKAVSSCNVLIGLIGKNWLDVTDSRGNRRLDNPNDYVRLEIAAALNRKIRVIPILLHGTSMPLQQELPENLVSLSRRNALEIRHSSFDNDVSILQTALLKYLSSGQENETLLPEIIDESHEVEEKSDLDLDIRFIPSPNPASLDGEVNWTVSIANQSTLSTPVLTIIHQRKILTDDLTLTPEEVQWISFHKSYEQTGEHSEKVLLLGTGISQEVEATVEVTQPPKVELSLDPSQKAVAIDEKATWHAAIKNIGDEEVFKVLIYHDQDLYADPFDLAVGEQRSISFTKRYPQEGRITERVDVSVMTKFNERVQFYKSAAIQVGSSSQETTGYDLTRTREFLNPEKHEHLSIELPIKLELIHIPPGEFIMGSDEEQDSDAFEREIPQHLVELGEYSIGKTPVTNGQYLVFLESSGHQAPPDWGETKISGELVNHPVVSVSWYDAIAFCEWLTEQTGRRFSLPSEAEWEKAARGMYGKIYPWGNKWEKSLCNTKISKIQGTTPVGHFSPEGDSPYGCVDMAGNVWEWTRSLYGENPIEPSYIYPYDPDDGRENLGAAENILRVVRGGAWYHGPIQARCAYRGRYFPDKKLPRRGFRVIILS